MGSSGSSSCGSFVMKELLQGREGRGGGGHTELLQG